MILDTFTAGEKYEFPDERGHFGPYGGRFVPETLMPALFELEAAYHKIKNDPEFQKELEYYLKEYVGRATPLYFAEKLTQRIDGAKIYLKREDLNHTGAHKINNTIAQALLAKRMGKRKIIAETGAGQHGVAAATAAALFGLECTVFMGEEDIKRQSLNVFRMKLLGAKVESVVSGSRTLKDATNEAIRYWVTNISDTYYIIGSVVGPHPYPMMVRDFQAVIGEETKQQMLEKEGCLPDKIVACVGGGSNAMGMFYPFIEDKKVELIGVEAAGLGIDTDKQAATLTKGRPGVVHGSMTYLLQDGDGQIIEAHSISAGLDYPGVGPEHSCLRDLERVKYEAITDAQALEAFQVVSKEEGIIPALESSHALAQGMLTAKEMAKDEILVICLSGRGDKDVEQIARMLEVE